jgi:hypothetical protein
MPQDLQNKPKPEGETTKLIKGALIMLEKERAPGFIILMNTYSQIRVEMDLAMRICREQGKDCRQDTNLTLISVPGTGSLVFRSVGAVACCPHAIEGLRYPILIDHSAHLPYRTMDWVRHHNRVLGWEGM